MMYPCVERSAEKRDGNRSKCYEHRHTEHRKNRWLQSLGGGECRSQRVPADEQTNGQPKDDSRA